MSFGTRLRPQLSRSSHHVDPMQRIAAPAAPMFRVVQHPHPLVEHGFIFNHRSLLALAAAVVDAPNSGSDATAPQDAEARRALRRLKQEARRSERVQLSGGLDSLQSEETDFRPQSTVVQIQSTEQSGRQPKPASASGTAAGRGKAVSNSTPSATISASAVADVKLHDVSGGAADRDTPTTSSAEPDGSSSMLSAAASPDSSARAAQQTDTDEPLSKQPVVFTRRKLRQVTAASSTPRQSGRSTQRTLPSGPPQSTPSTSTAPTSSSSSTAAAGAATAGVAAGSAAQAPSTASQPTSHTVRRKVDSQMLTDEMSDSDASTTRRGRLGDDEDDADDIDELSDEDDSDVDDNDSEVDLGAVLRQPAVNASSRSKHDAADPAALPPATAQRLRSNGEASTSSSSSSDGSSGNSRSSSSAQHTPAILSVSDSTTNPIPSAARQPTATGSSVPASAPSTPTIPAAPKGTKQGKGLRKQRGDMRTGGARNSPVELDELSNMYQPALTDEELSEDPPDHKSGYVAVIGRPNAGKSTLINALVGQKLSIVSCKPQTTRHRVMGIASAEKYQMILFDTPGIIQKKRTKLEERMMAAVVSSIQNSEAIIAVVDSQDDPRGALEMFQPGEVWTGPPMAVLLNKSELLGPIELERLTQWYKTECRAEAVFAGSALNSTGVEDLKAWAVSKMPEGPTLYPKGIVSEQPERFFVSECIREQIFLHYDQEIPYSTQVVVKEFVERHARSNLKDYINAQILVEKDSQKGILIGKNGDKLKAVGSEARREIEAFLGRGVFLELSVQVSKDWRDSKEALTSFGYFDAMLI